METEEGLGERGATRRGFRPACPWWAKRL